MPLNKGVQWNGVQDKALPLAPVPSQGAFVASNLSRRAFFVRLWRQRLFGRALGGVWFGYGAALAIKEGVSDRAPPILLYLRQMMPSISLAWWLTGAAVVLLIWCFEASFRSQKEVDGQLEAAKGLLDAPTRLTRERMAVLLADDRLKMIDLLESHTHELLSYRPEPDILPLAVRTLAARFSTDVEFGEKWNDYSRACLDFFRTIPNPFENALRTEAEAAEHRRKLFEEHRLTKGMKVMEARDAVRATLLRI